MYKVALGLILMLLNRWICITAFRMPIKRISKSSYRLYQWDDGLSYGGENNNNNRDRGGDRYDRYSRDGNNERRHYSTDRRRPNSLSNDNNFGRKDRRDGDRRRGDGGNGPNYASRERDGRDNYRGRENNFSRNNRYKNDNGGAGSGRGRDDFYDNRDRDRDENYEPIYGRYDGDHIFGIQPVRAALRAGKRDFKELIVQSGTQETLDGNRGSRKEDPNTEEIIKLATDLALDIREFSKHDLNMMSGSRPHQGYILRAKPLEIETISALDILDEDSSSSSSSSSSDNNNDKVDLVLALDEVMDPMNFGALLRSAYFLGCKKVVVCSKNSAPLSPVVSKASAGAMEVANIVNTKNMMRFLDSSRENGWNVVGTALGDDTIPLNECTFEGPTILVLGNEGHGMRKNVQMRCNKLVKLGGAHTNSMYSDSDGSSEGKENVDSLNVSVTGGILMHHILFNNK